MILCHEKRVWLHLRANLLLLNYVRYKLKGRFTLQRLYGVHQTDGRQCLRLDCMLYAAFTRAIRWRHEVASDCVSPPAAPYGSSLNGFQLGTLQFNVLHFHWSTIVSATL